jgi:hypothetical protein
MRAFQTLLFVFASLLSFNSLAALENADWKTKGDNLAFIDPTNNKLYLDFSETQGMTIVDVLDELEGGVFSGWRLPTQAEIVSTLLTLKSPDVDLLEYYGQSYFILDVSESFAYDAISHAFLNISHSDEMERTQYNGGAYFLNDDGEVGVTHLVSQIYHNPEEQQNSTSGVSWYIGNIAIQDPNDYGVWLVKDVSDVPLKNSALFIILALSLPLFRKKALKKA